MVRIVQYNDWVAFIITGGILLYIFMLLYLQRDSSVKVFLMQHYADSSNNLLSWLIISLVFTVLAATVISQSIPLVPKSITAFHFFGYELNKFGYTLLCVFLFYILRTFLSYIFYAGTGSLKRWSHFLFISAKFYFVFSLILMAACIYQFYYEPDRLQLFNGYLSGFAFMLLFKLLLYILSPDKILPERWYYKILYICTLQIVPVLVLWKALYF